MNAFETLANAAHEFREGLVGATIETAVGEFLTGTISHEIGGYLTESGERSVISATEASSQVPLIGDNLSRKTYGVLSGLKSVSRYVGKGTAYLFNKNIL